MGIAQFMVILDNTIVNVALPSIQRGLHFSPASLQWIVNAYTLAFGGFLMLGGRAADLVGRRRLFLIGIVLFSAASLMNGLAGSAGILVAGRAVQGLGGALVTPAALSVLTTTFAEGRERTAALGVWSAIAVGGGAVGLLLGGMLTSLLSWQWIFFVNVPVGVVAIALALRFVPESRGENVRGGVDIAGAVSVTGGLVVLVYALVNAQTAGWISVETLGLAAIAIALLVTFVILEGRLRHPLIRLGIFRMRSITGANSAMLLDRRRHVRDVLLRLDLRAGSARIQRTPGGPRVPPGDRSASSRARVCRNQLIRRVGVRAVGHQRHVHRRSRARRPEQDSRQGHLPR